MFPPMAKLLQTLIKSNNTHNSSIRPDKGLTLETSAFQIFHGGNLTFINSFDIGSTIKIETERQTFVCSRSRYVVVKATKFGNFQSTAKVSAKMRVDRAARIIVPLLTNNNIFVLWHFDCRSRRRFLNPLFTYIGVTGVQGWRSCESAVVRALASHQCGPGSIPRSGVICGLSLLVLYSATRGFLRVLWFPLSSKINI